MKVLLLALLTLLSFKPLSAQELAGHTHDIIRVKFDPNAATLISYSAGDGWLCLWDVRSGRLVWRSKTEFIQKADEYYTLTDFAYSPDRSLIASASGNGTVQLWDARTGKFLWRASAFNDSVTKIAFSPDGQTLVAAASPKDGRDEIKMLRVADGRKIMTLVGRPCTVIAMRFNERGDRLLTGNLDGNVSEWDLKTGTQNGSEVAPRCLARRTYEWETSFAPDLTLSAARTGEKELTLTDARTKAVLRKFEAEAYRVYSRLSADGGKLIVSGYGGFSFYDLVAGDTLKVDRHSGTGSAIDLSRDGSLFAEGGSYGNATIRITETGTGKSWSLGARQGGGRRPPPPYRPGALEIRLTEEKARRQAALHEARARRDRQAAIDIKVLQRRVYITFEHYGEMIDPGERRMMESDEPGKSMIKKSAAEGSAVWLRLHNDSSLPIKVPTQSMYLPNRKCFYEAAGGVKVFGLCDGREISIWHGLEDGNGEEIPYGFDFGSSAILLPKTSAVFPVPLEVLGGGRAVRFSYTFQRETGENKVDDYGSDVVLRFKETDLPRGRN